VSCLDELFLSVLKKYDAEICNGIWPIVIADPAGLRHLHYIDPKTLNGRKHAFRKMAWLVRIRTCFTNLTSFSRKSQNTPEIGAKDFYHLFCYRFVNYSRLVPSIYVMLLPKLAQGSENEYALKRAALIFTLINAPYTRRTCP